MTVMGEGGDSEFNGRIVSNYHLDVDLEIGNSAGVNTTSYGANVLEAALEYIERQEDTQQIEFVAALADTALYGITCMQTFLYFVYYYRQDPFTRKLLVLYLWFMDTVHQVLINRGVWILISSAELPSYNSKEYFWGGLFTALVAFPTQLYFIHRIWIFSGHKWIFPAVFVPCSLFQLGGYIAFLILCLQKFSDSNIIIAIEKLPMAFWGVGAAEDILIALTLIWLLWKNHDLEGFRSTTQILHRLSIFIVNTGVWTALCALFTIITLVAFPTNVVYVSLYFLLCPLYCNSLLANLNARGYIRGENFTSPKSTSSNVIQLTRMIRFASNPSTGEDSLPSEGITSIQAKNAEEEV